MRRLFSLHLPVLTFLTAGITLLAYDRVCTLPDPAHPLELLPFAIPLLLILNGLLLGYLVGRRSWWASLPLVVLSLGYPFLRATFRPQLPFWSDRTDHQFTVLSYNVGTFNMGPSYRARFDSIRTSDMLRWLASQSADVICLQEFYDDDYSLTRNAIRQLIQSGRSYYYITPLRRFNPNHGAYGMAIFSRYPIVGTGEVVVSERSLLNKVMYADIRMDTATVRVYNMHLESLALSPPGTGPRTSWREGWAYAQNLGQRLRIANALRQDQIRQLIAHVKNSSLPTVLCGDLNDTPYSFAYQALRRELRNGFEHAGRGFGFSYNGWLWFLRIDQHFFNERLRIHQFRTHREANFTEHFPVSGAYSVVGSSLTTRIAPQEATAGWLQDSTGTTGRGTLGWVPRGRSVSKSLSGAPPIGGTSGKMNRAGSPPSPPSRGRGRADFLR